MAIDRPLATPVPVAPMGDEMEGAIEIEIVNPESVSVEAGGETVMEFDEDGLGE